MKKIFSVLLVCAFLVSGCATPMTKTEKGAVIGTGVGAATGAILGQAIGGNTTATVLGAVAGAAVGGITGSMIGDYMDKQERELNQRLARIEGASVQRQQDVIVVNFTSDLLFDVDSSNLKRGAYQEIDYVAGILNKYPETTVKVSGHTDSTGSERHNLDLSQRRAGSVKNALADSGVNPRRISSQGFGESMPVASNATEAGRQLNRRVSIEIIPNRS